MRLALIAHDGKKSDMVAFVMKRLDFFNNDKVSLVTTGTTLATNYKSGHIMIKYFINKLK